MPERIGPYRILEQLGEGGMGMVYLAQQEQPFRRRVALKIIKLGMDTREVIARFESERQALALMNHPHIARVFDAGTTEQGRPYFVMEHVAGISITKYCDQHRLSIQERLQLFTQVCQAIHHAHQKSIIHRDIKASNVLVAVEEGKPVPKVIDFGVAKATNQRLTDKTLYTQLGSSIGTPEYMSPEQAESSGLDVDKTTDIYSLGVLLYELLVGVFPFNLLMTRFDVMLRTIRDKEPPKLTIRLSSLGEKASEIAERRHTDIRSLSRKLRGELDWITQKAMEKDRTRRYQAASELAADIGRYLKNEPVLADPPSVVYQLRKFLVRHRTALAPVAWGGVVAALVVLLVGLNVGGVRERLFGSLTTPQITSLAVLPLENLSGDPEQEYFADGITEELIATLAKIGALKVISPTSVMRYRGSDKPLPEIARELGAEAVIKGSVIRVNGRVRIAAQLIHASTSRHLWAGNYERDQRDAVTLQGEVALAIAREIEVVVTPEEVVRLAAERPVDPAAYEVYLRGRYFWNQRTPEGVRKGIAYFQQAVQKDPDYAPAHVGLADSYLVLGSEGFLPFDEATRVSKTAALKALELDDSLAEAHASLGWIKTMEWDWLGAEREFERAIELNPNYAFAHHWYSRYLQTIGRHEKAIAEATRAQELDPFSFAITGYLGASYYHARRYDQALEVYRKLLQMNPNFWVPHYALALAYEQKGMYEEAIAALQQALTLARAASSPDCKIVCQLGHTYATAGRRDEARKILEELKRKAARGQVWSYGMAALYAGLGDREQALQWLERALDEEMYEMHLVGLIRVDPLLDPLRSDPRFQDLLRRMNFPEEVPR
ncbi:MAG: protein kinase [Candidatus Acidoferrales bacterium]